MIRTSLNALKYPVFQSTIYSPTKFLHKSCTCSYFSHLNFSKALTWKIPFLRAHSSQAPVGDKKNSIESEKEQSRVWTIPNLLCCARISASPLLCYYILNSDYNIAISILLVAGFSDLADGFIARKFPGQASKIGTFLDPLADKVLVISLFSTLTYTGAIPGALTSLIVLRDVVLLAAGFYIRYSSLTQPKTLKKFFDGSQSSAELKPSHLSKLNTVIQLATAAISLYAPNIPSLPTSALEYLWYTAGLTTILSGLSYAIFHKKSYKIAPKRE